MHILEGELYIGLYTDYWENDGALCRLNNQTYSRTERDDRQQLNGWCTLEEMITSYFTCKVIQIHISSKNFSIFTYNT